MPNTRLINASTLISNHCHLREGPDQILAYRSILYIAVTTTGAGEIKMTSSECAVHVHVPCMCVSFAVHEANEMVAELQVLVDWQCQPPDSIIARDSNI